MWAGGHYSDFRLCESVQLPRPGPPIKAPQRVQPKMRYIIMKIFKSVTINFEFSLRYDIHSYKWKLAAVLYKKVLADLPGRSFALKMRWWYCKCRQSEPGILPKGPFSRRYGIYSHIWVSVWCNRLPQWWSSDTMKVGGCQTWQRIKFMPYA